MIKLILIELKKVFKKKSIFVMMIIIVLFNLLNNILFYTDYDSNGNYKYLDSEDIKKEKSMLEEELLKYDPKDLNDVLVIIDLKTKLDVIKIKEKYDSNTWQYNKVSDYLYNILESINVYTYQIMDEKLLSKYKKELEFICSKFNDDDWKYFVNLEINSIKSELIELNERLNLVALEKEKQEITDLVAVKNGELKNLEYRLKNNITYDNSYLNLALNNYEEAIEKIDYYEERLDNLTLREKIEYQNIKENLEINKYILDKKENYNKQNNLNYQLRTIVEDYEIFVIIVILIVASTIVAEEFKDGTIKLLLIKPYSRGKILLSKYFTVIIVMLFVILYLILLQLLIGGYIFGFSSLEIPVIVYDFNKMCIVEYNVFVYMIIRIIAKLPMIIMVITISFCFSTIIGNVVTSITIPLFIYIFTSSVNSLILQYKINILKYLVNINWEFNNYLFGRMSEVNGGNFKNSLIIWIIYFIIIVVVTFLNFKKKNIKNV